MAKLRKTRRYKVVGTERLWFSVEVEATSKAEARRKFDEYVRDGADGWDSAGNQCAWWSCRRGNTANDGHNQRRGHVNERTYEMKMAQQELEAKLRAHKLWLDTRGTKKVKGERLDLSDADLRDVDLRGADLSDADLSYADLNGANLADANLADADLADADLADADLNKANLAGADLSGADLRGADLHGADLSYANLARTDLNNANLARADLSGANLDIAAGSPEVCDALTAVFAARMALAKTRVRWRAARYGEGGSDGAE